MELGKLVGRLTAAFERGDRDVITALCSPDVRVRRNNDDERGLDMLVASVGGLAEQGITIRYSEVDRVVGEDAVAEQHVVTLTRPDGDSASSHACLVVGFDADGLVARIDEYVDTAAFMSLVD